MRKLVFPVALTFLIFFIGCNFTAGLIQEDVRLSVEDYVIIVGASFIATVLSFLMGD